MFNETIYTVAQAVRGIVIFSFTNFDSLFYISATAVNFSLLGLMFVLAKFYYTKSTVQSGNVSQLFGMLSGLLPSGDTIVENEPLGSGFKLPKKFQWDEKSSEDFNKSISSIVQKVGNEYLLNNSKQRKSSHVKMPTNI